MKLLLKITLYCALISFIGCFTPVVDSYKYIFTGQEGTPPLRTIDAAKAQFNDNDLVVGQSNEEDLEAILGSPSEIKKNDGKNVHIYIKNVSTQGVSVAVGTIYIASYTFGVDGKLADKEYAARSMSNPLTGQ